MEKCPSCGFDLEEEWKAKDWEKRPSCGVNLHRAEEGKVRRHCLLCGSPRLRTEYVCMSLGQMRSRMMTLVCSVIAIASACFLDWTNVIGLGPVNMWNVVILVNHLPLIRSDGSTIDGSPTSSATILVTLLFVFLLTAFLGAALTVLGMYRFTKAPMSEAASKSLLLGLCVLGGAALLCLVVIVAVSSAVCNQFSIFCYSTTDGIASATAGPFITLISCAIGSSLLMRDGEEHTHLRH